MNWADKVREALGLLDLEEHGSPGDPGYAARHGGGKSGGGGGSGGGDGKAGAGVTLVKNPGKPYVKMNERQRQVHKEAVATAVARTKVGQRVQLKTFNGGNYQGTVARKGASNGANADQLTVRVDAKRGKPGGNLKFDSTELATMRTLSESMQEADVKPDPKAAALEAAGKPKSSARDGRIRQAINLLIDAMGALDEDEDEDPVQQLAADAEAKARIKSALLAARESLSEALEEADPDADDEDWEASEGEADDDDLIESDQESGLVLLEEKALRPDGTLKLKLISPGWGSKGYYRPEVLQRDGPKAWPVGTHMYWNHPTEQEEALRPERDLRDLAAVTVTPPVYMENGPKGPGLYADAKAFSDYQKPIEEMAEHIGVSIRAAGVADWGEAEGRTGNIVEGIVAGKSVDFVTKAGRGGEILQLFESARGGNFGKPVYTPGNSGPAAGGQEDQMTQQELEEARRERDEARTEAQRLLGQVVAAEAATYAAELLKPVALSESAAADAAAKSRLIAGVSINPPIKDGKLDRDKVKADLAEAAKTEVAYIATITGQTGEVRGLGLSEADADPFAGITGGPAPKPMDAKEAEATSVALFQSIGLSEAEAKQAAAGRN